MSLFVDARAATRFRNPGYSCAFSFVDKTIGNFPGDQPPYTDMLAAGLTGVLTRPDVDPSTGEPYDPQAAKVIQAARSVGLKRSGSWHDVRAGERPLAFARRVDTEIQRLIDQGADPTLSVLDVEKMGKRVVENGVEKVTQAQADAWHEQMTAELFRIRPNRLFILSIDPLQDVAYRCYIRYGWHIHVQCYDGPMNPYEVNECIDRVIANAGVDGRGVHATLADAHLATQMPQLARSRTLGFSVFLTPMPGSPAYQALKPASSPAAPLALR